MGYAGLAVHVDQAVYRKSVIEVALKLAATFDAHLTALHTYTPSYSSYMNFADIPTWGGLEAALREEEEAARQHDDEFKARFESQVRQSGALKTEWCYARGELVRTAAMYARCADLMLMSQRDPDDAPAIGDRDTPAQVALLSGRPILVVPYVGSFDVIGKRIVIAWKGTREATRAVAAALPLLVRAESVDIVTIGEDERASESFGDGPGADVALYLARHCIKSSVSRIPQGDIRISETLLSTIADRGADLLCMGAYGHSRLRQLVMGGVTYDLMRHMTVPTLIAG